VSASIKYFKVDSLLRFLVCVHAAIMIALKVNTDQVRCKLAQHFGNRRIAITGALKRLGRPCSAIVDRRKNATRSSHLIVANSTLVVAADRVNLDCELPLVIC